MEEGRNKIKIQIIEVLWAFIYISLTTVFGIKQKLLVWGVVLKYITRVFAKYLIRQSNKSNFVLVDDVRYINELNYLKKNGFILVKLVISPQFQKKRIKQLYGEHSNEHLSRFGHSSETIQEQIDDKEFDVIIDVENDNVNKILEILCAKHF